MFEIVDLPGAESNLLVGITSAGIVLIYLVVRIFITGWKTFYKPSIIRLFILGLIALIMFGPIKYFDLLLKFYS